MSTTLRFREHREFHRAAFQMILAGAVAGVAWLFLARAGGSLWGVGLLGGAVALAALVAQRGTTAAATSASGALPKAWGPREVALRGVLVALGTLTLWADPRWGQVGFALGFAAALLTGQRGLRLAVGIAVGAAVTLVAGYAVGRINTAAALRAVPDTLVMALAGGSFALISAVALVARHVELVRDPVGEAYGATARASVGEIRALVDRGHAVWTEAAARLPAGDANRTTLEEGALRLFEVARRWRASEADGAGPSRASLGERMDELDRRIEACTDTVSRDQYRMAREALAEQVRYIENIDTSRERVVARMHNYVAAMERFRLAAIRLDTATASRAAVDVAPLAASLDALGADMDACCDGLAETDRALAAPATAALVVESAPVGAAAAVEFPAA